MSSRFPEGGGGSNIRKRKRELIHLYEAETSLAAAQEETAKKRKDDPTQQPKDMAAFFSLLEDENIRLFLARDSCRRISDKYLLAMVFIYFRRSRLRPDKYKKNFFPALFLANQFEEEEGRFRREIYPWALGRSWYLMKERRRLFHRRDLLFLRMGFKAWVNKESCDLIMAQDPLHWAWTRERQIHHGAAVPSFRRNDEEFTIHGPWSVPPSCPMCETILLHPCEVTEAENIMCHADTEEEPGTSQS